jgi:hypothetical protein
MSGVRLRTLHRVSDGAERRLEFILNFSLSVHQPDRAKPWRFVFYAPEPRYHLGLVCMGAVTIDYFYARVKRHIFSEDL